RGLFKVKTLDPAFDKVDASHRKEFVNRITNDAEIQEASQNWKGLSVAERVRVLQKAVDAQSEILGLPQNTLRTFEKPRVNGRVAAGYYSPRKGTLKINVHPDAFSDFHEALATAVHENAHRYQHHLTKQYRDKSIPPDSPMYETALSFRLNDLNYVSDPRTAYLNQPQELHSEIWGMATYTAFPFKDG
ncbi:hypothetical protein ACFL59_15655, partial [Planctomycetota bacterium]